MMIRNLTFLVALAIFVPGPLLVADPIIVQEDVTLRFPKHATAEEIYSMVAIKAKRACRSRAVYAHENLSAEAQCRKQFIEDAVSAIDRPRLTALHHEQAGTRTLDLAASEK
jgi:hypothetical protein